MEQYTQHQFVSEDELRSFLERYRDEIHSCFEGCIRDVISKTGRKKNVFISFLRTGILLDDGIFLLNCTDEGELRSLSDSVRVSIPVINKYIYDVVSEDSVSSYLKRKVTRADIEFYQGALFEQLLDTMFVMYASSLSNLVSVQEVGCSLYFGEYLSTYHRLNHKQAG